jgi:tRNA(fMet)-specific endonuclease VapC
VAVKKVFLDTTAYSLMKTGSDAQLLHLLRESEHIGVSVITLGELLGGFHAGKRQRQNIAELKEFINAGRVELFALSEVTAEFYALIYKQQREIGKPVPTNDLWIAASCMEHGFPLYTRDKHFQHIKGIVLL